MEYRLAADGNTDDLRQWLRTHPERVNVPAPGSNMTLLYTAITNAKRTDLASLQAGHSRYLNTVRMLCEEYKADVSVPNGGTYNTALHAAASLGATDIVRYLVETAHAPVTRANMFGETAVQVAERANHGECVAILRRAAASSISSSAGGGGGYSNASTNPPNAAPTTVGAAAKPAARFQNLTISDSDDDEKQQPPLRTNGPTSPPTGANQSQMDASNSYGGRTTAGQSSQVPPRPPLPQSTASGYGVYPPQRGDSAVSFATADPRLPQPVRPRKEYDISKSRILANPDLQGFRSAYGDGFKYIQCSDHYEIRGILPYTYRGTVYYTPVIISVYAPATALEASEAPTGTGASAVGTAGSQRNNSLSNASDPSSPLAALGSQRSGVATDSPLESRTQQQQQQQGFTAAAPSEVYCRFRVCLNMQSLNDFAVSRKAEYLDPVSGAVIPAPGDDKYQTLTAYIRNVVVRNFESVPPLIVPTSSYAFPLRANISRLGAADNTDAYKHHHSHNAPSYLQNALPKRSAAHLRCAAILRDLSRFGDGLGRYFPANHRIVVYVPLFSEHKAAVLAMPQERPYTTTVDQVTQPPAAAVAGTGGGSVTNDMSANNNSSSHSSAVVGGGGGTSGANASGSSGGGAAKKAVTQQVAAQAVAELQVRVWMQFAPTAAAAAGAGGRAAETAVDGRDGGVYAYPPRVYLIDAAARPPAALTGSSQPAPNALTGKCFASILRDRDSGEVSPELLKLSQESWAANGSVYDILVELQRLLRETLEAFAIRYTGRRPESSSAQQAAAAADSFGGGYSSGAPAGVADRFSPAPSPLDDFFTTPTTQLQPSLASGGAVNVFSSGAPGSVAAVPPTTSSAGHCLYCFQCIQTRTLLQPCGHDGVCGLCVQRLQSHCREEVFACPVCRQTVRSVMEVFL